MNSLHPDEDKADNKASEFEELLETAFSYVPPRRGEIRNAIILQIDKREAIVDLGAKQDGIVPAQDLDRLDPAVRDGLQVGSEVPVYVRNPRDHDDNLIVSINMGFQQYDWDHARKLLTTEDTAEVTVTGYNRGGILVKWNRLEGFIPSSHLVSLTVGGDRREELEELRGKQLVVKIIEVDQDRRRLIFSEREAQREWRTKQKARLLAELNEGDVVSGTVTGLRDFGAFVNLGGADGLIHVSELAWHRVDHPRDILQVGAEIQVYILNLDRESNRIALSRKRLLNDPWEDASERFHEGQLIEGTVTNVVDFGAFIALDNGLEGLLHLSEMGDGSLKEPFSYVQKGDRLNLRISRLEPEKRRVGFTQRWGTESGSPEEQDGEQEAEPESIADDDQLPDDAVAVADAVDTEAASADETRDSVAAEAAETEESMAPDEAQAVAEAEAVESADDAAETEESSEPDEA